jgi:hypothetical protein
MSKHKNWLIIRRRYLWHHPSAYLKCGIFWICIVKRFRNNICNGLKDRHYVNKQATLSWLGAKWNRSFLEEWIIMLMKSLKQTDDDESFGFAYRGSLVDDDHVSFVAFCHLCTNFSIGSLIWFVDWLLYCSCYELKQAANIYGKII